MTQDLRLLVLEDDAADAELITERIDRAGFSVTARRVDSKEEFAMALRDFDPDVVISDHSLHQFNARGALKLLRAIKPAAPLIVVSGGCDEEHIVSCIRAGAADFVLKENLDRLVPAIESALTLRLPLKSLTPRQLEVFRLVAEGQSTREVARKLRISVKTVETHRGEVMKRIGIHDVAGLVRYAIRVGLTSAEA